MRRSPATVILPAAGRGARFGADGNKLFEPLLGKPILAWTLEAFAYHPEIAQVVLVGAPGELDLLWALSDRYVPGKVHAVVQGGQSRQDSVRYGLDSVSTDYVVVHDAARCCVSAELIQAAVGAARLYQAVSVVRPVTDTLVRRTGEAVDRESLVAVETPQAFQTELLRRAHLAAKTERFLATDDATLVRRIGRHVHLLESAEANPKVTYPSDLLLATLLLEARLKAVEELARPQQELPPTDRR